uniref:Reverse transcriptase domain-containing protein n=1 Tax=Leptobrachium leishanense TaxID=445787 RepID=A0A8C5QJ44_9ANUR
MVSRQKTPSKRGCRSGRTRRKPEKKRQTKQGGGIYNLTDTPLTDAQTKLLKKGLKYAPTSHMDIFSVYIDLQKFKKNICLKKYFAKNPIERVNTMQFYQHTPLKEKSTFYPKSLISQEISTFEQMVMTDLGKLKTSTKRDNLTKKEKGALKELASNETMEIKPADKGGGIVIMTATYYKDEANRILGDTGTYRRLNKNPSKDIQQKFDEYLEQGHTLGILNNHEFKYLKVTHPRTPVFYFLPKIHKDQAKPPGRPIISGVGSISSRVSEYLDHQLQPYVVNTKAHLKDTTDVLNILKEVVWQDDFLLVTSDVQSLYTIIPHEKGLEAIEYFLKQTDTLQPEQTVFILEGIRLILENNYFYFNDDFFLQLNGTAMGTRFAPSYANLFMAHWEESFLSLYPENLVCYKRYIDDIFLIWKGGENLLREFLVTLDQNSRGIKLTTIWSNTHINFLDLSIHIQDNRIKTETFFKTVDVNSFIEKTSCHLPQWLDGVPKGQFLRIRRNCTDLEAYDKQSTKLKKDFIEKGYNEDVLEKTRSGIKSLQQEDLLKKKQTSETIGFSSNVPFIFTYNAQNRMVRKTIRKYWPILRRDPILKDLLPENPRIICRGVNNLKMKLTNKHTQKNTTRSNHFNIQKGFHQCGNCLNCRNTRSKKHIITTVDGTTGPIRIKDVITCFTKNVIYLLTCPCGMKYIGRTTRPLNVRIQEHIRNIRNGLENHSVPLHF